MLFDDAVAQLRGAESAGFDISVEQAGVLVLKGVRRLAALSEWLREIRASNTVIGQADYSLLPEIVKIRGMKVGGAIYIPASVQQLWDIQNGDAFPYLENMLPASGVFAENYTAAGDHLFTLDPVPTTILPITSYVSVTPTIGTGDQVPFPDDFNDAVIDAARQYGYEDIDEDPDMAAVYKEKVEGPRYSAQGILGGHAERLRRRANSQVGSGGVQIQVKGYHFS